MATFTIEAATQFLKDDPKSMMKVLITLCLLLLSAGIASAQLSQITFAAATSFSVGNATLPAGMYFIQPTKDPNTFKCVATSGSPSIYFEADEMDQTPSSTGVTFMQYGKNMVLKQFSVAGIQEFYISASLPEKQQKKTGARGFKVSMQAKTTP
jgi:hypothetical protein